MFTVLSWDNFLGLWQFMFHGLHFNHDSQNSFQVHHYSWTPKMVYHGVTKIPLPPSNKILGTLRFTMARGYYGYIRSKSLSVMSPRKLQYGFPAVASFSATSNCLFCLIYHYVSINCRFFAILRLTSLF